MAQRELFDLGSGDIKSKEETMKKYNNFLYNKKAEINSDLPLQELEENILGEDIYNSSKQLSNRKKSLKKRRNNNNKINNNNKNINDDFENMQISGYHSPEILSKLKSDETPNSFSNILKRQDELKIAVNQSRQAFAAYKVSSFFCFNTEFIKDFGENLFKVEQYVKDMEKIVETAVSKELTKVSKSITQNKDDVCSIVDNESNYTNKVATTDHCPISPPDSKIKNNIESPTLSLSKTKPRKRKIFPNEKSSKEAEKRVRKVRKCTVSYPMSPKIIVINKDSSEESEKMPPNVKQTCAAVEENIKEEYEVRKIQDFVRRQGGSFYRVSWKGYDSDEDTFEPADHLDGCEEVLLEFFCKRLEARGNVTKTEELKNLALPADDRVKDLLYAAFERMIFPISNTTREKGIKFVTDTKAPVFKPKEELQDDILKFLAFRDPSLDRYKKLYTSIIEQVSFREIYQERLKQFADLRSWERSMNIICSDPAPLYVENNVDLTLPPLDFIYINEYVPGPNIVIPSDPMAGCECKDCGPMQRTCCAGQMGSYFAYTKNGRLRVSLGTPIYECNKACKCSADCINRVVQNGRKFALSIFRTSNDRGWGVKTLESIKKDQFVSEYVGEVISSDEAELRGMKYDTKGCTYLFDLDYNKGDQNPYTVDAFKFGNVSHFINHSCDPNLVVFNVWVNCLDPDLPKLALFAARDIKKGEEITFDYNSGSTKQISIMDKIDDMEESLFHTPAKRQGEDGTIIIPTTEFVRKTPRNRVLNAGKTKCRCGAVNCRDFFF